MRIVQLAGADVSMEKSPSVVRTVTQKPSSSVTIEDFAGAAIQPNVIDKYLPPTSSYHSSLPPADNDNLSDSTLMNVDVSPETLLLTNHVISDIDPLLGSELDTYIIPRASEVHSEMT